jgi:molybdenum cofactor biosynthesis protein B
VSADEHKRQAPAAAEIKVAVTTVSDTRTEATDVGGRLVRELCDQAGITVASAAIVRDEPAVVASHVRALVAANQVHAVLLTGGTGIARRDTTVEALAALFDKTLDGFGELFRLLSFQEIGSAAMLSRATAGVMGGVLVFLMPGSPKAVALAMSRLILPELGHMVAQLAPADAANTVAAESLAPHHQDHHDRHGHPRHGHR